MKSLLKYVAAVVLCAGLFMPDALALDAVPHNINIQGVLRNVGGEVVTGTYSMKFVLYDAVTVGNVLCQNISPISVTGGVFNTAISCPSAAFVNRTAVYLGITVGTDPELPRVPLASVGFAIQAEHAEQADELLGAATDVICTGCIGVSDVAFNYAASDRQGGPATDVNCYGCVSGGAPGDITANSITTANIGDGEVKTDDLANLSVTNNKLATDSVYTGNIKDGQVTTPDLATGAVTSAKLGTGAVGDTQLSVNYALGTSKGGPAADLNCVNCVADGEAAFNYALGTTKGGPAANVDCLAMGTGCIEAGEVSFTYAASATKNGAASDLACTDCVGPNEVQINYAASATEGGDASGLACTGCVGSTDMGVNYANSNSKGGDAIGLTCAGACVSTGEVDFNWAASATKGGPANDLVCTGCVVSEDIGDGSVVNADISGPITGSKITTASATDLGVVKIGSGIKIELGVISPDYSLVAQKNHEHSGYFRNELDILKIGDGKYIDFLDPGDNPGSFPARITETSTGGDGNSVVTLSLGNTAATPHNSGFEITGVTGALGRKHYFSAGGNAYHAGDLQFDGNLTCKAAGCVDSADIVDNSVTGTDILNGTITGSDLASNISLTTTGTITASTAWASKFIDKDEAGGNWYADPYSTSIMNGINFVDLRFKNNNAYGLKNNGSTVSLYTSTIDAGANGETLYIAKNICGQIDVYGSTCGSNIMTVHGTLKAKILYDEDNGSYYVDPASHSIVNTFQTATARLPATGTTTNYIDGTTYAFNGPWYDTNGTGYYVDPASTSSYNVIVANGFRTSSWPGEPAGANGQVAGNGSELYLVPPPNGPGQIYMRNQGVNKIVFSMEDAANVGVPSFRTNGGHMVINPASGYNLYLNWDVGSGTLVGGTFYANNLLDIGSESCMIDGGGTTTQNSLYAYLLSGYQAHFFSGLRVDGGGIYVNGDWNPNVGSDTLSIEGRQYKYGIVVDNGTVIPAGDNQGSVGVASFRWRHMYTVNTVWVSNREEKKEIKYLTGRDMDSIGAAIQQIKPATWLYNFEVAADSEGVADASAGSLRSVPHIGLILDEMPALITNGGEGWYANDTVGFLLVASKYLDDKINRQAAQIRDLEDRIALMEQILVDAGLYQ